MPKKSKINIFNKMEPKELHDKIKECNVSPRYYQRLIAMRLIEKDFNHNDVANILGVSYRSINRWAHLCEEKGLDGLEPDFSGGKKSKLTPEMRVAFQKRLRESKNLTMTGAKKILKDEFGVEFSLGYVGEIVRSLGFNYGSPHPKYREADENPEQVLKKNIDLAGLKPTDKFLIIDESTSKTDFETRKTIYEEGTPNEKEITAFSFKRNFLGVLGLNVESTLFAIKNLDEFEFGKSLFKIRSFYSNSKEDIKLINEAIGQYTLSKKQITKKLEEKEDNPEFLEKLLRSIENNKKDKSMVLARKLNKHCKRESTENKDKRKDIQKEHVYQLINELNLEQQLKNDRLVIFLDSAPAHTSTFVQNIAKMLNILFVPMPKYAPWLNPVEKVWSILKDHFRAIPINSKSELTREGFKVFNEKCLGTSLTENFIEKYMPILC